MPFTSDKSLQQNNNFTADNAKPNSATQNASDIARSWGFGIVPNILANLIDEVKGATSMAQGKGKYNINPQTYDNPFRTYQEAKQATSQNPVVSGLKDTAAVAPWLVAPELGLEGASGAKLLGARALSGAAQGGLSGVSEPDASPQSVAQSTGVGAVLNTVMPGLGNLLFNKYGSRLAKSTYGDAAKYLPEVMKAESKVGGKGTLKQARDVALNIGTKGMRVPKDEISNLIDQTAKSDAYIGTEKLGNEVRSLKDEINNPANSLVDLWHIATNKAYSKAEQGQSKLASFQREIAHKIREKVISNTANPEATRQIMDAYAHQTEMNAGKKALQQTSETPNLKKVFPWLEALIGGAGVVGPGISSAIPGIAGPLGIPLAADALLKSKAVGPYASKAFIKTGQAGAKKIGPGSISDLLRHGAIRSGANTNSGD